MSVKSLRGIFLSVLAITMLLVLSSSALAASIINPGSGNSGKSGGDYEMERDLEGGIHLVCNGIRIDEGKDICIDLTITTEDDVLIEVSTNDAEIFDANNRRFVPGNSDWAWVGDTRRKREVIGGIPISASVWYNSPDNYALTEFYPRVSFTFNGKKLTFRNVPAKE